MITVIGVAGGSGTGKDFIVKNYLAKYGFQGAGFADHFKVELIGQGKITWEEAFVTKPEPVRELLQARGHYGRIYHGEGIWVDTLFADLRRIELRFGLQRFAVTDCRYPNEVDAVRAQGGTVWGIYAPTRWANNGMPSDRRNHESEQFGRLFSRYASIFDGVIQNDPEDVETVSDQVDLLLARAGVPTRIADGIRIAI